MEGTVITTIHPDSNLVYHTVTGEFTAEKVRTAVDKMVGHPDFKPGMDSLWDLRGASINKLNQAELLKMMEYIAAHRARRGRDYKVAIVVASDLQFGFARMYELMSFSLPSKKAIFRNTREAFRWLKQH